MSIFSVDVNLQFNTQRYIRKYKIFDEWNNSALNKKLTTTFGKKNPYACSELF